ncbi:MAG: FtsX-like permease family protein, partial [Kiloniellales bacterium]
MRALDRKLVRDLWRSRAQALAIALVVGCGVATFVMSLGTLRSLEETRAAYYEQYRFADVFASLERAPEGLAARIGRIPGVKRVETRIVKDVTLDVAGMAEPATGRLVSLPAHWRPGLNDVTVRRGRYLAPTRPDEVLVGEAFAEAHGLGPGDTLEATINGRKRRLSIVGVALSPEYVYSIGPGVIVPDDRRFGVLWMAREALAAAFDLDGAFNDVSLSLMRAASTPEVLARLDGLLEPYGGIGAYDRSDQLSDAYLSGEMDQLSAIGKVVPPIFLAVAIFLLYVVLSRLIDTEREQIGLLKAFGYGNAVLGWHYLKFVLVVVGFGVVIGMLGGAWLGHAVTDLYTQFFRFPFLYYRPSLGLFASAALITVAAAGAGTLTAVRRAASLAPATAMAPAVPTVYRKSPLERLALSRFSGAPTRMILRQLGRWPLRAGLTTLGIAMAVAILVGSLFTYDAVNHMIDTYFHHAQRQDVTVTFVDSLPRRVLEEIERLPGVLAAEP